MIAFTTFRLLTLSLSGSADLLFKVCGFSPEHPEEPQTGKAGLRYPITAFGLHGSAAAKATVR